MLLYWKFISGCSSAKILQEAQVSQRGRATLRVYLYLISTTVQYLERSLLSLVTSASDLSVSTIINFGFVLLGVKSRLAVTNKIHWCVTLRRDGLRYKQTPSLSAMNYSTMETDTRAAVDLKAICWSKIAIFAPVIGSSSKYCRNVWYDTIQYDTIVCITCSK